MLRGSLVDNTSSSITTHCWRNEARLVRPPGRTSGSPGLLSSRARPTFAEGTVSWLKSIVAVSTSVLCAQACEFERITPSGACLRDLGTPSNLLCLLDFSLLAGLQHRIHSQKPQNHLDFSLDSATRPCFWPRKCLHPSLPVALATVLVLGLTTWPGLHAAASLSCFSASFSTRACLYGHLTQNLGCAAVTQAMKHKCLRSAFRALGPFTRLWLPECQLHTHLLCTGGCSLCVQPSSSVHEDKNNPIS